MYGGSHNSSEWFGDVMATALEEHNTTSREEAQQLGGRKVRVQEKLFRADEAFVEGKIGADSYERLKAKYVDEMDAIEQGLARVQVVEGQFQEHLRYGLHVLGHLDESWHHMGVDGRHMLVGSIWPDGVVFNGEDYRTSPPSELLLLLSGRNASISRVQKNRTPRPVEAGCPVRWS